jgi:putative SOS response-associated peptidase YedK
MCGRFSITLPNDAMAQLFAARPANALPVVPNYNVCPTTQIHVVRSGDTGRRLVAMRWGFLPHWYKSQTDGPLLINARAETMAGKPAFRAAARERRCIVVASGFYEWTKGADGSRLPWYIFRRDGATLAFGAIWQDWGGDDARATCAIATTAASEDLGDIHNRMPLILAPDDWPLWLGEAGHGAARLMRPAPAGTLEFHRVGTQVNSNRASGPDLIEPA